MKTKQALLTAFAVLLSLTATAQDFKCDDNFKVLEEKIAAQDYDAAATALPDLKKECPKYSEELYAYAEKVLVYQMDRAREKKQEERIINDLISWYDAQEKYFPNKGAAVKKAVLLHKNELANDEAVFKILDAALVKGSESFTDYNAIELYFNLYLKQYESGKMGITQPQFIEKYNDIAGQAAFAQNTIDAKADALAAKQEAETLEEKDKIFLKEAPVQLSALDAVMDNMRIQASKYFNCDALEVFYAAGFDKNKEKTSWLEGMVLVLNENKCQKSEVLYNGALALHKLKPSYKSAYLMGNLSLRQNKKQDAIQYFNQAADLQAGPVKKSETYNTIASVFRNMDKAEAKKYALKAIEANPQSGKPYLFLAELYTSAGGECGLSSFDKKALVWLAMSTAQKAAVAEPKYKTTVASLLEKTYSKSLPTAADVKAAGKKKGDTITYGCWINETVTIPKM